MRVLENFAIMRTGKIKSLMSIINLEKHCSREKMPWNADPERTKHNQTLIKDTLTLSERFQEMTKEQKIRKNAVLGIEVMMTYTPGAITENRTLNKWVETNRQWLFQEFGEENILRLWLHQDESTPHLHAFVIPLDKKGKLNCRYYLGGSDKLSSLQDRYSKAMEPYNLQRGIKGSKAHHKTVKEFYRAIEKVEQQDLPKYIQEIEKGILGTEKIIKEPIERYYQRANIVFKQQNFQLIGLYEKLRKEKEYNYTKNIETKRESIKEKHKLKELRQKAIKAEQYKAKAEAWDRLNKGLNNLLDQNHAKNLKNELQGILDSQKTNEVICRTNNSNIEPIR